MMFEIEVFDKKLEVAYTDPGILPEYGDLLDTVPQKIRDLCSGLRAIMFDHYRGNIRVWKGAGKTWYVAYYHCEHDTKDRVLKWCNDFEINFDIILWDGYWEKLLLSVSE